MTKNKGGNAVKRRTDIEVTPLGGGVWRLNEYDLANCYLIEGTEKACLIDTGVGIADVAAAVSKMTDKPLTVLITHAHEDHLGGGGWFKEVFIHPADRLTGLLSVNPFVKMWYLRMQNGKRKKYAIPYRAVFQRDHIPKLRKLSDGNIIELDTNDRLLIPPEQKSKLSNTKDIVLTSLGGNFIEIWDYDKFTQQEASVSEPDYVALASDRLGELSFDDNDE